MSFENMKPKTFWERPEGVPGMVFGVAGVGLVGLFLYKYLDTLVRLAANTLYLILILLAIGAILYVLLDPKFRNLIWYFYKSIMRGLTSMFVRIDPIGILESYIDSLRTNLRKMDSQIGSLRGQLRKLQDLIAQNNKTVEDNLMMATSAQKHGKQAQVVLKTRKAGRLQDSNLKLTDLYKKMEILYRILTKMYETSEVLLEDVIDQVAVKKMEREAIHASHSAMRSAMNIISGNSDKRILFDQAMEAIAEDVSRKVGEMEHFMDMSSTFIESLDLQNGVYEEKGLAMLEQWEKEGVSFLLGNEKSSLINSNSHTNIEKGPQPRLENLKNQYDNLFNT